jgi:hypothetical protein
MKHTALVLFLTMAVAAGAHVAWFQFRRPCADDSLDCRLAWMRAELHLTDAQFARVESLHRESRPSLVALAARVARMRAEYDAFERERRTVGEIDFLEFARFVEERRRVDRECHDSTRRLIAATVDVMSPEQRTRYLGLLGPLARSAAAPN